MAAHLARRAVLAAVVPVVAALSGCGSDKGMGEPGMRAGSMDGSDSPDPARPTAPVDILQRAREAMAAEKGWTFTVTGRESLTMPGQANAASYTSTVRRTNEPEALHSTGTIVSNGTSRREEVLVVGGVGYVREGGSGAEWKTWKTGPVSAPDIGSKVEDPVLALEGFETYAEQGADVEAAQADGEIRLRVYIPSGQLSDRRQQPALAKAAREFRATLDQLREAGVTASEREIVLRRLDEVLILDAATFRITSHHFAFGFLIPYQGQRVTYNQEVREENRGVFDGTITPPRAL